MEAAAVQPERQAKLRLWQHCTIFLLACVVIVSRRPDAIFHAQLYAEDGHVWFADAYNLGWWPALFRTWTGYYLTLPRLGAALALLVPLSRVPLLLNVIAILFHALPVNLLLISRSSAWGSLRFRAQLAAMYLVLPNCFEISSGITDANWLLALSCVLLLVASTPKSYAGRLFDVFILLLCGLTGPFCIFLAPISIFLAWKSHDRWRWMPAGILILTSLVQARALLYVDPAVRAHTALGASPILFARILAAQIYLGAVLGGNGLSLSPDLGYVIFLVCVAIAGTAFITICFLKCPLVMKVFLVFSAMILAGSLISPLEWGHPELSIWALLSGIPGLRYWFFPTLAFAWALLCGYQSGIARMKAVSATVLCLMCIGVLRDWRHPALQETHFAESVKRFEAAPVGATVIIPVHPQGWSMELVKHTSSR
jgi:hypothetical protein